MGFEQWMAILIMVAIIIGMILLARYFNYKDKKQKENHNGNSEKSNIEDDPIAMYILLVCKEKIPQYKENILHIFLKILNDEEAEEAADKTALDIRRRYLDAVYNEIYHWDKLDTSARLRLLDYRNSNDGENGIMAGWLYAAIYPSFTGKEADPCDCITLNHVQNALMDGALAEIDEEAEKIHNKIEEDDVIKSNLSVIENDRIAMYIFRLCKDNLPQLRADILAALAKEENAKEDMKYEIQEAHYRYLDAICDELCRWEELDADTRSHLIQYRESEYGKYGIMADNLYDQVYKSTTGKESDDDIYAALGILQYRLMKNAV